MSPISLRRRIGLGLLVPLALVATATTAPAQATPVEGACTDDTGVTVVVDFTDLGGQVEVGCATDLTTGTAALTSAGFVDTRDAATMICAIDSLPDPCPAEFEGSYWSYWHADQGGEWESYMEGSDTAVPTAGSVEGWRYNDGSEGPGIAPPVVAEAAAQTPGADDAADDAAADDAGDDAATEEGTTALLPVLAGVAVLAAVAAVLVVRRRRSDLGPAGQD